MQPHCWQDNGITNILCCVTINCGEMQESKRMHGKPREFLTSVEFWLQKLLAAIYAQTSCYCKVSVFYFNYRKAEKESNKLQCEKYVQASSSYAHQAPYIYGHASLTATLQHYMHTNALQVWLNDANYSNVETDISDTYSM